MPKEGYKTITVENRVYEMAEAKIRQGNKKAKKKKYRSVAHFIEEAIVNYEP